MILVVCFFSSVCAVFVLTVGGVAFAFLVFVQNNQRNASEGKSSNGISRVLGAGVGPILPRKKIIDLFFFCRISTLYKSEKYRHSQTELF